jgi:hypothetical protein
LTLTVTVNGADAQATIPAQGSAIIENVVAPGTTSITLEFRGDRRLILVETDFR